MKLIFRVTVEATKEEISHQLTEVKRIAQPQDVNDLLEPGSVLELGDLISDLEYTSELEDVEA